MRNVECLDTTPIPPPNDPVDHTDPMGLDVTPSDPEKWTQKMTQTTNLMFGTKTLWSRGVPLSIALQAAHQEPSGTQQKNSSAYHNLGNSTAENDQKRLGLNKNDPQYMRYIGSRTDKDGSMNFKITPIEIGSKGHAKDAVHDESGVNQNEFYNKRADPKGERDPMRSSGYRTVGVIVSERRFLPPSVIHDKDVINFHKAGLDAFVSYPAKPPDFPQISVHFWQEHNVDP